MSKKPFQTRDILKEVVPKYCRGVVVDLGCGYSKYKPLIIRYAQKYVGIDNQTSTAQFDGQHQANLDFVSDVTATPLEDNFADTVICTEVIEHVPDPFKLMAEISRILKPEGHLILSSGWVALYHPEPKDYWRFSPDAYEVLCQRNQLKILEIHKKGGFLVMMSFLCWRWLDLKHKKIYQKLARFINYFYRLMNYLDNKYSRGQDTIGHLIVAVKQ